MRVVLGMDTDAADDMEVDAMASPPAATTTEQTTEIERRTSQSCGKHLSVKNRIQASFGSADNPDYVFDIAGSPDSSVMAVSLSTNVIKLYSPVTGQHLGDLTGHSGTISEILFSTSDSNELHSSSLDGTLRTWDIRSKQQVSIFQGNSSDSEMFSFSIGGSVDQLFAAGANSQLFFWDRRYKRQVACLEECHMEDVTQVRFHPIFKNKLVSGSVDGLMCTINTEGDINDDDQLESVMNAGTSVAKIGFFGALRKNIWCLTNIESLSIWDWENASQKGQFNDARLQASARWDLPQVDYFVECHYSPNSDILWLVGGTNEGSLGYFSLYSKGTDGEGQSQIGCAGAVLQGGHSDVIRCVWSPMCIGNAFDLNNHINLWTGGEDGRLCHWSEGDILTKRTERVFSGLVMKSSKNSKCYRHHPY